MSTDRKNLLLVLFCVQMLAKKILSETLIPYLTKEALNNESEGEQSFQMVSILGFFYHGYLHFLLKRKCLILFIGPTEDKNWSFLLCLVG